MDPRTCRRRLGATALKDRHGQRVLTAEDCRRRLRDAYVGRLAYLDGNDIVVVPVNFRLDVNGAAVVRSGPGGKLDAARARGPMTLQIDGLDEDRRSGWSVCLVGAGEVVEPLRPDELDPPMPLRPWSRAEPKEAWIRVVPSRVEGREVGTRQDW